MNIDQIKEKYGFDSAGAFGNVNSVSEKSQKRQKLHTEMRKGTPDSFHLSSELFKKVSDAQINAGDAIKRLASVCEKNSSLSNAAKKLLSAYYTFHNFSNMLLKQHEANRKNRTSELSSGVHSGFLRK